MDPDRKNKTISSIGEKWRTFKNNLTTKYITPFISQPELLTHPPKKYCFLEQEHWDAFVRLRVSQNFQDLSKLQKERRAKNINNHPLSKNGHAGLEEELEQTGISVAELDRSVVRTKARQDKRGEVLNEAIKEKAKQTDELTKQVEEERVVIKGSKDIEFTVSTARKRKCNRKVQELETAVEEHEQQIVVHTSDLRIDNVVTGQKHTHCRQVREPEPEPDVDVLNAEEDEETVFEGDVEEDILSQHAEEDEENEFEEDFFAWHAEEDEVTEFEDDAEEDEENEFGDVYEQDKVMARIHKYYREACEQEIIVYEDEQEQRLNVEAVNEEDPKAITGIKSKGRGPTTLSSIFVNYAGAKKVVKYNSRGQPVGPVARKLASYLGVLARIMVPITHQSWHKVPKVLKEELWNRAGIVFEVDSDSKKKIISAIGEKWRTFKNNLTTKYITPFIDQPELLTHPPKGYSFIEQEHWDVFVRSRVSQNFQDLSKLQKERRAKYIYNHRLSKKGYVGLEEELEQTGISVAELDRSVLWKKARQDKRGDFLNEAIKEKADQIDELTKQVEQGRVVIEGSKDILTTVLGTKEHSGRVRGIGKFVSPRTFFNLPRRGSTQYINELEEKQRMLEVKLEEEMEIRQQQADELLETKQMVLQLQAQFMAIMGQSSRLAESPCLVPLLAETSSDIGKTASRDKIQTKDDIPSTVLNSRLEESREKSKTKGDMPSTVPNSRLAESRDMRKTKSDMPSTVSNSRLGESRNKSKTKDDVPSIVRNSRLGEGKPCRLTFGSQTTIVARAVVFERLGPKERIHNIMLGESNVRVTIEHAVAPDVLLPLPSGDMTSERCHWLSCGLAQKVCVDRYGGRGA